MDIRRPRVLILEGELHATALEAAVASRAGCATEFARTLREALQALNVHLPEVLLLGFPAEVEGAFVYDLLETNLQPLAARTIVLTTCTGGSGLLARAAKSRVFAVIARPFEITTLIDAIQRCVRNDGRETRTTWIGVDPAVVVDAVDPRTAPPIETVH